MMVMIPDTLTERGGATLASGVMTTIAGPFDMLKFPHKSFSVLNQTPSTISGAQVQVNQDPIGFVTDVPSADPLNARGNINASMWEIYEQATFQNLRSGQVRTLQVEGVGRWWRIVALNDRSVDLTASGYIHGVTT